MLDFCKRFFRTYKLLRLLEQNDFFYNYESITADDKKQLSNLFVRPEYKALVKLWDLAILSLQRNVLTEESDHGDLKVFLWCQKIQNFIKASVYNYHKSYADPKKWNKETSPVEGIIDDLEALRKISISYGGTSS